MNHLLLAIANSARRIAPGVMAIALISQTIACNRGPAVKPSDAQAATEIMTEVLQQWQAGRTVAELRGSDPPIYVAEDLWMRGYQLTDFSLERPAEVHGTNIRMYMKLKLSDPQGKAASRSLRYLVTTTPAITIARED